MTVWGKLTLPPDRRLINLAAKVREILDEISEIEADVLTPAKQKLCRAQELREELNKVSQEVDNIKREFNLLAQHRVN